MCCRDQRRRLWRALIGTFNLESHDYGCPARIGPTAGTQAKGLVPTKHRRTAPEASEILRNRAAHYNLQCQQPRSPRKPRIVPKGIGPTQSCCRLLRTSHGIFRTHTFPDDDIGRPTTRESPPDTRIWPKASSAGKPNSRYDASPTSRSVCSDRDIKDQAISLSGCCYFSFPEFSAWDTRLNDEENGAEPES